jgi:hypothetical protein
MAQSWWGASPHARYEHPYVQWCGRGEAVRPFPIPIEAVGKVDLAAKRIALIVIYATFPGSSKQVNTGD